MRRIVVRGSLNVDLVARVPRLPQPGETIMAESLQTFPGGKGANQAAAAARLGGNVAMIGRVGDDVFGTLLVESLRRAGVGVSGGARDAQAPAGAAPVPVDPRGDDLLAVAARGQRG